MWGVSGSFDQEGKLSVDGRDTGYTCDIAAGDGSGIGQQVQAVAIVDGIPEHDGNGVGQLCRRAQGFSPKGE